MGLDLVELMYDIEEAFEIDIPDSFMSRCRCIADIADVVIERRRGRGLEPIARPRVVRRLRVITARFLALPYRQVTETADFARDLDAG